MPAHDPEGEVSRSCSRSSENRSIPLFDRRSRTHIIECGLPCWGPFRLPLILVKDARLNPQKMVLTCRLGVGPGRGSDYGFREIHGPRPRFRSIRTIIGAA